MMFFPLNPTQRTVRNIQKYSRKLNIQVIVSKSNILRDIVVIGNGTPDDVAFSIVAHDQNGEKVVGIVKPEKIWLNVIDFIPIYLQGNVRNILILIDQEDKNLALLYDEIKERITRIGIQASEEDVDKRVRVFSCTRGAKKFRLIFVINGLDDIPTKKHTIEDHLVKAASIFENNSILLELEKTGKTSKEVWKELEEGIREKILRQLTQQRKKMRKLFPQQILGCKYLEKYI
ncbi:MAG: hypothetical protein J7L47_05045 [Candidatus Odinarchaeota archaeon]|nr:hypothetical protein [Candidatus Odinarchaeota archaeon]